MCHPGAATICGSWMIHMPRKKQTTDNPKKRPPLLAQLADEPDKLFCGAFRQQYEAVCFRYVGETSKIEVLVISSRDTGPLHCAQTLADGIEVFCQSQSSIKAYGANCIHTSDPLLTRLLADSMSRCRLAQRSISTFP